MFVHMYCRRSGDQQLDQLLRGDQDLRVGTARIRFEIGWRNSDRVDMKVVRKCRMQPIGETRDAVLIIAREVEHHRDTRAADSRVVRSSP